jgi:hypothetical protein
MKAYNVTTAETTVVAPGPYEFIHIQNVSDTTVYLKYDGSATALTTANGFPLAANQTLMLNNDNQKQLFRRGVTAIHGASGNKEIRVQGTD